jgi:hypothetical protein
VTQLSDDVNDLDDGRSAGPVDPGPEPGRGPRLELVPAPDEARRRPADELEALEQQAGGEPLFEQLREAYLHRDDTHDWAHGNATDAWVPDDADQWSFAGYEDGAAHDQDGGAQYRWVEEPPPAWASDAADWDAASNAGTDWDEASDAATDRDQASDELDDLDRLDDLDLDVDAEDDLDDLDELDDEDDVEAEPLVPRAHRSHHRSRSAQSRAGLRRTSTLLNTSTVLIFVVGALAAAALTGLVLSSRLLTTRQLFFLTHSTFGIIIVHAFGGGLGTLLTTGDSRMKDRIRKASTFALAVVAWLASAVGTWFGYAGYRAKVPPGGDIAMYPREYLLNSPQLAFWETFAMEWKVHIGWTTPFLATAVAFVALRYRRRLVADRLVRKVMTIMLILAFAGALVAAVLGAVVNVTAPNDFMHRGWSP